MARQSQPYKCYSLGTNDCPVFDVREFAANSMINRNVYHESEGKSKKVSWMKAKMIYHGKFVGSTGPSCLGFVSSFHYDEEIIVVDTAGVTRSKSKRANKKPSLVVLVDDSSEKRLISEKKLSGILSLVKKKLIPSSFHHFYESLNGANAESDNEDEFSEYERYELNAYIFY